MLTTVTLKWQKQSKKKKWLIFLGGLLIIVVLILFLTFAGRSGSGSYLSPLGTVKPNIVPVDEPKVPNPLNGVLTPQSSAADWDNRFIIGVMIENLNITRPQTGLSRADIVYEALTEGEITRFMGVYLSETSDLGPVRSLRAPFEHWISEYDGAIVHVGGSTEALAQIGSLKLKDMDGGAIGAPTFQRINNRGLDYEHTLFTSTQKLWDSAVKLGYKGLKPFDSWLFKNDVAATERPTTQKLTLKFTGDPNYIVNWDYHPDTNDYTRSDGGVLHIDAATGEQIRAKDVIVEFIKTAPEEVSPGKMGRSMDTSGGGEVRVFRDGISIDGTWVKPTPWSRTKFLDNQGKEIELNRGKIWVEVNPTDTPIEYN